MTRFQKFFVLLVLCVPFLTNAQTGKIIGKVTDLETGEPLIGANILIEATNFGAATNEKGEYLILSIPPGTYTLKARFIGYREVTFENIKVSVNLTTEANFQLPSETYQTETITVVAPKPLIEKNITNSTSIVRSEDIENLPVRGVNTIVGFQAGVIDRGGNLYVRGSRRDAVEYYVDGVLVNNPVFGGARTQLIQNAIEEIQVQAGGYSAEFGGANGGIISTQTRAGSDKYKFNFEAITDNFTDRGEKFLGGYTYGYSEYVLTAGGPIIPDNKNYRFFLAGSNTFNRMGAAFYREYNFPGLFDPALKTDTFDVIYPNYRLNAGANSYQVQGNLTFDFNPFTIRLNGSFAYNENRDGVGWNNYLNFNNTGYNEDNTITSSIKLTHVLSPNSFYDVILNYFDDFYISMDPIFKHDILLYGDSAANAAVGRELRRDGENLVPYRAYGFEFNRGNSPYGTYRKQSTKSLGGKANFLYQLGRNHELKTGGDFTYYTIRRYSINAFQLANNVKSIADGDIRQIYRSADNYGYDIYGNLTDEGEYIPRHPVFAAFYIQDKMEFSDLVLQLGFRWDYIDVDAQTFANPANVQFDEDGFFDRDAMVDTDPISQVSPRIGFSFPVTDRTVFHAQYGKFIQQTQLRDIYLGFNVASDIVKGGYAYQNPVGYGIRPERTTSYEIGFKQQVGDVFAFDITGFYKDIKDQVQLRATFAEASAQHRQYYSLVNGDFSTVKGIELKMDLRRTERVAVTLDYTYSDAQGTGSTPNDAFRAVWQSPTADPFFPLQIAPLSFNQTHRGALNVDYRFADNDGPEVFGSKILSNTGVNLLLSFNSGTNYTRWTGFGNSRTPLEPLNNSVTPWNSTIDARLDKSFSVGSLGLNVYLLVINVLNTRNIINVFPTSGDPYDNGFLASPEGAAKVEGYRQDFGEEAAQTYKELYLASIYGTGNFGQPRQIRLGIRLDY